MPNPEAAFERLLLAFTKAKIWVFGATWDPDPSGAPVPQRRPSIFERLGGRLVAAWERRHHDADAFPFYDGSAPVEPRPRGRSPSDEAIGERDRPAIDDDEEIDATIPSDWLTEPTTIEAAESANMVDDLPFGGQEARWRSLTRRAQPSDQFWWFLSPPETWRARAGRMGVALVRDGKAIGHIVTLMN